MTALLLPMVQTWSEVKEDFAANTLIYLSMPFVAAFVGYTTKLLFLQMMYRPLEFRGIGWFGWQGIVPRRAGKVAATTIDILTEKLLRPEELLDKFDAQQALEELREPLEATVDSIARELAEQFRPGLWDSLPEAGRRAVLARVHAQAPEITENLLAEIRSDLPRYVDLKYLTVTTLVRNKEQLNDLMKTIGGRAMGFVRRSGIWFGFAIGLVQMVAWGFFQNPWIMPVFGFSVGFLSDWLALTMLFRPHETQRYLGLIPFQGILHQQREQITRDYAQILAKDLFAPDVLFDGILNGPTADKLFDTLQREISAAIDAQTGIARPLVVLAVGTRRYGALKATLSQMLVERLPQSLDVVSDYATRTLDIENTIVEKMSALDSEQYEAILRPVFKDDELLMIGVGGILGGLVGELQVQVIEHFSK
ncbi:DUF445 family protein [Marmoricola sp. RAF53]|uniref:DUF445 family protein n=1 Tax=Marmoricola sp. RAF53 TaxID=3233059 RepID=UPI003F9A211C